MSWKLSFVVGMNPTVVERKGGDGQTENRRPYKEQIKISMYVQFHFMNEKADSPFYCVVVLLHSVYSVIE